MDLERIQHALPGNNDLFGLFLNGQGPDQSRHLLSCLPLSQLTKTFLSGPHDGMDNLEEQLTSSRVEDEDGTVDGFGGQVTLECFVDGYSVDVGVVYKPDDLVAEELSVVLRGQVGLGRLTEKKC